MTFGHGAASTGGVSIKGADFGKVDMKTLPSVLPRITALGLKYPIRVAISVACSLGAAFASLALPQLFGQAVNQAHDLLVAGAANAGPARQALLVTAAIVIAASTIRGLLTMTAGYQGRMPESALAGIGHVAAPAACAASLFKPDNFRVFRATPSIRARDCRARSHRRTVREGT